MRLWRLTSKRFADAAFSGLGNKRAGSRWVPAGRLAVYTSEHASTAVLEMMVHIEPAHFRDNFVLIKADLPDDLSMDTVELGSLPDVWRSNYEDDQLQQVGLDWLKRGESVSLKVPSAVVPYEHNVILNPEHLDFDAVTIHEPELFIFDSRLDG